MGHKGISLCVHLQDGALLSSSMRRFVGKHRLWYAEELGPNLGHEGECLELCDWVFGLQCEARSCSNAMNSGFMSAFSAQQVEGAHIVAQSLVNSSSVLHELIRRHLLVVHYFDDLQETAECWELMAVSDQDLLLWMVEVNPRWAGTYVLRGAGALAARPQGVGEGPRFLGALSGVAVMERHPLGEGREVDSGIHQEPRRRH